MRIKLLSRAKSQDSKSSSNNSLVFKSPIDIENKEDSHHYHSFDSVIRKLSTEESFFLPKKTKTPEKNIDSVTKNESQFIFHEKDILNKRIGDKSHFELDESLIRHSESEIFDHNDRAELLDLQENIHTSSHEKNQLDEWSFLPNFLADIPNYVEQSHQTETYRYNDNSFITPSISLEKSVENYMPGRNYNNEDLVNRRLDGFAYILHYIMENGNVNNTKPTSIEKIVNAKNNFEKKLSINNTLESELINKFTLRKEQLKHETRENFKLIEDLFNQKDISVVEKLVQLEKMNNTSVSDLLTLEKFLEKAKLIRHSENQIKNLEDIEEYIKISESNNFLEQLKAEKATPLGPCLAMTQINGEAIIGLNGGDKQNTEEKACKAKSITHEITKEIIEAYCLANVSKAGGKKNFKQNDEKIDFNKIANSIQEKLLEMVPKESDENYIHFKEYVTKFADFIATSSYGLNYLKAFMKPFELVQRQEKTFDSNDEHAEVAILDYLVLEKRIKEAELYIANNKKACPDCGLAMKLLSDSSENNIIITWGGTHADDKGSLILPSKSEISSIEVSTESQHKSKKKIPLTLKLKPIEDLHEARYYIPQFIKASKTLSQKFTDKLRERLKEIKSHEKSGEFNKHLTSEHKIKYSPKTSYIEEGVKSEIEHLLSEYKKSKITQTPQNPWFQQENANYLYTEHDIETVARYISSNTITIDKEDIAQLINRTKESQEISKESRLEIGELYRQAIREQITNELIVKELVNEMQKDEAFAGFKIVFVENGKGFDQKQSNTIGLELTNVDSIKVYLSNVSPEMIIDYASALMKLKEILPHFNNKKLDVLTKLKDIKSEVLKEAQSKIGLEVIESLMNVKLGDVTTHLFQIHSKSKDVEDIYKYCKGSLQGFLFEYHQRDLQDIKEVLQGKVNIMMPGQANPDFENYPDTIFLQLILGDMLEDGNYQYTLRIHLPLEHNKQTVIASLNLQEANFTEVEDQDYIEAVGTHPLTSITILQLKQAFAQAERFLQDLTTVEDNPYLNEMAKDGTWGGETELGAIAEINNLRQIFIYNQKHELINSTVINENGDQTIYLQRVNDNHYNAYIGVASEDTLKEIPGGGNCMFAAVLYAIDVDYRGKDKEAQLNDIKQLRQQVVDTIKVTLQNDPDLIARQFKLLFDSESKGMFLYRLGDLPPTDLRTTAINIHKELQKSLTSCNIGIILTNQEESSNFLEDMIIMNFLHQDNTLKKPQKNNSKLLNEEELELQKAIEESLKSGSFEENVRQAKVEYHNKILKVMTNIDNYEAFSQKLNLVKINCTEDFENLKKASLENIEEVLKNIKNKDVIIPRLNLLQSKSNEEEELCGIDPAMHGLTPKDIQINLADIVKANLQTDFYIRPNIMEQEELLLNLNEWQNMQDGVSLYAALVKVTNQAGVKHAILLSAQQTSGKVQIIITEPLAKEDSTFGTQLNELHNALKAQGFDDVGINYAGTQDKNYGTCTDMSLIMLQELIEQAANKPILDTRKKTIVDNFDNNHIDYDNGQLHNFDYDNHHPALLGQDHNETI